MKKIGLSILMTFLVLNVFSQGISFEKATLEEAFEIAKKENKLVFIDCYTSWCAPCKGLALDVFPQEKVGTVFNEKFISLKKDMESEEGKKIAEKYDIHSYPTLLWLDAEGVIQHRYIGFLIAEELIAAANLALDIENNWVGLSRRYEAGERDLDFVQKYIVAANEFGKAHKEAIDDYLIRKSPEDLINETDFRIIRRNVKSISHPVFKHMLKNKEKYFEVIDELYVDRFFGRVAIYELWDFKNNNDPVGLKAKMEELVSIDEDFGNRMIDYYEVTLHEGKPTHHIAYLDYKLKHFYNNSRRLTLCVYQFVDKEEDKVEYPTDVVEKLRVMCDRVLEIDKQWGSYELYAKYLDATGQDEEARILAKKNLKMIPEDKLKTSSSWWILNRDNKE